MKTGYRFLSKFAKLRNRKVIDPLREYLLYSLLFQDDLYSIVFKRPSSRVSMDLREATNLSGGYSIISIKRIINGIRQQDLSEIFSPESDSIYFGCSNDISFNGLSKVICAILKIVLSPCIESFLVEEEVNEWKSSRSLHSVFPFLEDRLLHSNYVIEKRIPHTLHSEVFIRMFRQQIKDAPFLHLPRLIFYIYTSPGFSLDYLLRERNNSLALLVWNFYMYEIESLAVPLWKQFSSLHFKDLIDIFDYKNTLRKKNQVGRLSLIELTDSGYKARNFCIHYGRYENCSIVILKGTRNLAKKWISCILEIAGFQSHSWFHFYRMAIKKLSRNCILFLGYIIGVQSIINEVQVGTLKDSFITVSIINQSLFQIPVLLLIRYMERKGFCDSSGYPVTRSAWTTLTDHDIRQRFIQIWKIISLYYSGSINRDHLYRLRYILQFSCGKTLACKHKCTMRIIRRRLDLRVFLSTLSLLGDCKASFFLQTTNILKKKQRFWYLEITKFSIMKNL